MAVYIDDNKLVIITKPKTIHITLAIKINKVLAKYIAFL